MRQLINEGDSVTLEILIILLVTGVGPGVLAGLFGVGGGIIIVPVLIMVYSTGIIPREYAVQTAIATSLFTIIFTTLSSAYRHARHHNIILSAALMIGVTSSVMVIIFSKIAIGLPGDTLKKIFSVILVLTAIKMLTERTESKTAPESEGDVPKYNKIACAFTGIISGIIAAFSGLGGGIFIIALMRYLLKFPIKKSIGTSLAAILLTSISGVLGYYINTPSGVFIGKYSFGMVDTFSALPIIITSIPASQFGVYLHKKISHGLLSKLFAVFVILVAVKILFF